MESIEIIQIKEDMPVTHCFTYKGQQYPFNFDLFKRYSNYILKNQVQMEKNQFIDIINENTEAHIELSKEIIQDFIKFVHREQIGIGDKNVSQLHYLANKYEIPLLINFTENYIKNHQKDTFVQMLLIHQNEPEFVTKSYEDFISADFLYFINDERLLSLNFPVIYRIITKISSQQIQRDEVIEFFFKCLKKYGSIASILFEKVDFIDSKTKYLNLILNDYSNVFDFHYINSSFVKSMHEIQNELLLNAEKTKSKLKEQENNNQKMRKDIDAFIQLQTKKQEEQDQKIERMKGEIDLLKQALASQKEEQNEKMKKEIKSINDKYNAIIENMAIKIEELSKFKEDQIQKSIFECKYKEGDAFNGILRHLTNQTGGNIHDNQTIIISSNSINSDCYHPKNLVDFTNNNIYHSKNEKDVKICFDFKDKAIQLSSYSIKSYDTNKDNSGHLKSWVIEVSNDGENWTVVDDHNDDPSLNGPNITKNFQVKKQLNNFYQFVQLRSTGYNWCSSINYYYIYFYFIDFFGKLKTQ